MHNQDFKKWTEAAEKADYRAAGLARNLHVCRRQLERWTRLRFGQSPQQWLDEQQLEKAIELLKSEQTIKEVVNRLGFKQYSHFSRKFKEHHGLPPGRFVLWLKTEQPQQSIIQ